MSPAVPLLADNHNVEDNTIPENLPVPAIISKSLLNKSKMLHGHTNF